MATGTGTLMAGRYRKVGPIGVGGMARVFLAEDERLGRRVAIKQLHAESPDEAAERFDREAKLGASLNHPNLVSIYDVATDAESVLIVMEYVEGRTLKDAIAAGPLELAKVVSIIHDVAAALNHAHTHGIVHRDVKPANILLRQDGVTKLADLGIATAAESTSITRSGMVLGTASYMAPEQLDGQKAGPAADIYSLAAVAFEAVSGRKAMTGETPMEIAHRVISSPPPDLREAWSDAPAGAAEAISRGMAREPEDRPRFAGEFATALQRGLRGAKGVAGVASAAGAAAGIAAAGAAADPAEAAEPAETAKPADAAPRAEAAGTPRAELQDDATPATAPPAPPDRGPSPVADRAAPPPRPSTYRPSRRAPSWLPAAGAVAALCVIAVIAFSVFGGGGDDDKSSGGADKASQSGEAGGGGKSDSSEAAKDDSSSGTASGGGSGSTSSSGASGGSAQAGSGSAGSTGQGASSGGSASALNDQGFRLMNQGRYKEAIPLLEQAVAKFPEGSQELTYAFALYNLGKSLRLAGRPKEAVPILEKRLKIPNQTATVRAELEAARRAAG